MALLREAQGVGLVGPGPVEAHLDHVWGFAEVVGDPGPERPSERGPGARAMLDLGSGAGIPGLALALVWPASRWVLLDGRSRSTAFLADAVRRLGVDHRVSVVQGRAEAVARDPAYRATVEVVVARSVAAPSAVAECAAGFLVQGGRLVVSEPPDAGSRRWDEEGLRALGMGPALFARSSHGFHFSVVEQREACPDRYPRRPGMPTKRPLF